MRLRAVGGSAGASKGALRPTVNGSPVTGETVQLKNGDVVELAGTQMQFVQV